MIYFGLNIKDFFYRNIQFVKILILSLFFAIIQYLFLSKNPYNIMNQKSYWKKIIYHTLKEHSSASFSNAASACWCEFLSRNRIPVA